MALAVVRSRVRLSFFLASHVVDHCLDFATHSSRKGKKTLDVSLSNSDILLSGNDISLTGYDISPRRNDISHKAQRNIATI